MMHRLLVLLAIAGMFAACSSKPKESAPAPTAEEEQQTEAAKALEAKLAGVQNRPSDPSEMTITLRKDGEAAAATDHESAATAATEPKATESLAAARTNPMPVHHKVGAVPAEKALGWLKNGNRRFVKGSLRKDGQSKKDIQRLAAKQQAHSIIFTGSDSRVPPEIIFDQKLGEIFTLRTLGPSLGPAELASLEFAVTNLGANLLVMMGHTSSEIVKAAATVPSGQDVGTPYVNALVAATRLRLNELENKKVSKGFRDEAWANLQGMTNELLERSAVIREAVNAGTLKVQAAMYDTGTGTVDFK
ncbi:MAG: hypothetical protein KF802_16245 [Bdellovibrionaceae bacterium]|nr:hypothetical protein [Pseudobdellovibrionaceae bacterium]